MKKTITLYCLLLTSLGFAQSKFKSVLLLNGTAHIGTGEVINKSLIGIKNGKIVAVANALTITPNKSDYDTVIDIDGKHVYPGIIAMDVPIGLVEIEAVRATNDANETGKFNPNARTLIAYNADSKVIPTVRSNGVLLAQISPRGGIISGSSSLVKLAAWNWEDAALKADEGIHMNWPRSFKRNGWWAEPGATDRENKYLENVTEIESFFKEAKAYLQQKNSDKKDLRFESMRGIFEGKQTLFIHCNYAKEITGAVNFCREFKITKIAIVGGYDSWMLTDLLKENKVAVVLGRLHELPLRAEDDIDTWYKIPYLLQKAGVLFCLGNSGDQEAAQSRNIPFLAGTAAANGLTKEEALAAVTLNAAKILGMEKQIGSIEVGKDATLFVSKGDALDMKSNLLVYAFINGESINLNNFQYDLYRKFDAKYKSGN